MRNVEGEIAVSMGSPVFRCVAFLSRREATC